MIYAYDKAAEIPVMDLYNTQMMLAEVAAAKDMYEKGLQDIKDFKKEYWDFTTPSNPDQEWYNQNFTDAFRKLNEYADKNGISLTRSQEGRSMFYNFVNNLPISKLAQVKQTAENAKTFYENMEKLRQSNLYNPDLTQYEGGLPSDYSTIKSGSPWTRLSPTPYQDMGVFTKSYFDKLKPSTSTRVKNGVPYTSSDITLEDLHKIADDAFNDLIKTGQGQLMYQKFLNDANGDEQLARKMFNDTVVSGNLQRLIHEDDYVQNANLAMNRQMNLAIQGMRNEVARLRMQNQKNTRSKGSNSSGNSDEDPQTFRAVNAMQAAGSVAILRQDNDAAKHLGVISASDFNPRLAEGWLGLAQENIANNVFDKKIVKDINRTLNFKFQIDQTNEQGKVTPVYPGLSSFSTKTSSQFKSNIEKTFYDNLYSGIIQKSHPYNLKYLSQISTPFEPVDLKDFLKKQGYKISGDDNWFNIDSNDVNSIYTADEIVANMEGSLYDPKYVDIARKQKQEVLQKIKTFEIDSAHGAGYIITPMMKDGKQHIYAVINLGKYREKYPSTILFQASEDKDNVNSYYKSVIRYPGINKESLYIDLGVSTLGLQSLQLDESLQTMSRSQNLDKSWGVNKNKQYNDSEYILPEDESDIYDFYEDPFNF